MLARQQSIHNQADSLARLSYFLLGTSIALRQGVNPGNLPDFSEADIKTGLSVISTLGRANNVFGDEPELNDEEVVEAEAEPARKAQTKPLHEQTLEERKARWVDPFSKQGRLNSAGRGKLAYLVSLGWRDCAIASALGIAPNAVVQFRKPRNLPNGTVTPSPEEIEIHLA